MSRIDTDGNGETNGGGMLRRATGVGSDWSPVPGSSGSSPSLLEGLIVGAPYGIAVTEGRSHRVRRVNSAFCTLMKTPAEEALGRPYAEVVPASSGDRPLQLLERVLSSGEPVQDEEVTSPAGADRDLVWSYTVWPLRGEADTITGLVVEVRDRTHEVESSRRLQEMADQIRSINERLLAAALREQDLAEKAEAAARARTDFLAMMSHELRTPLNGIVGYTEVLLSGPTTEAQRNGLQRIGNCSGQLLEMINNVLSFAQVEASALEVRPERVDLHHLAREVAATIEPLAIRKSLELNVDLPNRPLDVETDPHLVHRILVNLMGNAVKFTPKGNVSLEVRESGDEVGLRVRDTGIGIAADDLERIFEPFVQCEFVLTRQHGGTGLGLAISRAIAAKLGGSLTVESAVGSGSTFTVRLPRRIPVQKAAR